MVDILNYIYDRGPVDEVLSKCDLTVEHSAQSGGVKFVLQLVMEMWARGDVYNEDQYYVRIPQDAFIDEINRYSKELGIQEEIDDLGKMDTKLSSDYFSGSYDNNHVVIRITDGGNFSKNATTPMTLKDGSYTFEIRVNLTTINRTVNVVYYDSDNNYLKDDEVLFNNYFTLSSSMAQTTGYQSEGWFTSKEDKVGDAGARSNYCSFTGGYRYWESNVDVKLNDLKLHEVLSLKYFRITFNANGGSVTPAYKNVKYKSTFGTLPTPEREGYLFDGWYTDASAGTQIHPTDEYSYAYDITVYAHWVQIAEFSIYDLIGDNTRYTGAYARVGDTKISDLPANPSREGYGLEGFALDSGKTIILARPNGTFFPNVVYNNTTITDSSSKLVSGEARSLYAQWSRVEYLIMFDGNGGEIIGINKITTISGKITHFPTVIRAGYELLGWSVSKDDKNHQFVNHDTIFSELTWLYAIWKEILPDSDVVCYLERYVGGVQQRLHLPIVTAIEDNITASLVEMDTIMFGYENRFVMDTGVKQSFSVTVERVNPLDYDDEQQTQSDIDFIDISKYSNSKWWEFFINFINFWQNNGYSSSSESITRRTGGFRFVYGPSGKDKSLSDLFPRIEKNVFIAGQVSARMEPGRLRFTLPLAVASMDPSTTSYTWSAIFRSDINSNDTFTVQTIIGRPMRFPSSNPAWDAKEAQKDEPRAFSHWCDSTGKIYYTGDELIYEGSYENSPPEFYAVWKSVSNIAVYIIKGGVSEYTFTADENCTVHATLYGGGGTGGKGIERTAPGRWLDKDWHAGGGGGASPITTTTYYMVKGQELIIGVGAGGGADELYFTGEHDGKPSYIYRKGFESQKIVSGYGSSGSTPNGGNINGGASGGHTKNGFPGKGSRGGEPGEAWVKTFPMSTSRYGGGGGGGSLPHISGDITVAYSFKGDIVLNNDTNYTSLTVISQGGRGVNGSWARDNEVMKDRYICDAYTGTNKTGYDISGTELTVYASAGGGGRLPWWDTASGEDRTPYSRGSNGIVILQIIKG